MSYVGKISLRDITYVAAYRLIITPLQARLFMYGCPIISAKVRMNQRSATRGRAARGHSRLCRAQFL